MPESGPGGTAYRLVLSTASHVYLPGKNKIKDNSKLDLWWGDFSLSSDTGDVPRTSQLTGNEALFD